MRIGISTSVIQRGQTGIASYLFSLLREFQPHAGTHEFVLFVLEDDLPLFEFVRGTMQLVPVPEKFRPPVRDILWHQTILPRLAREYRLDVLHVPSYRRLIWRHACPLVGTVHDLAAFHVRRKYSALRMFYGRRIAGHLARRQHQIIAVSQNTARDVIRFWNVAPERLTVIHHGLDRSRFHAEHKPAAMLNCHHQFGLKKPFFLYVARLEHPAKNHLPLIHAFERFKAETDLPWELVLAGSDWHGADFIHRSIQQSAAAQDIRCLGFVRDADLPMLYRAAKAFVYPTLHEGFGLPALEAMACGCPLLCSNRGALQEIAGDAALVIDPASVESMAAQMTRVVRDEVLRKQLADAGLAQAAQFDWSLAARRTLQVYDRAVESARHPVRLATREAEELRADFGR